MVPDSSWSNVGRARYYETMGYSASRLAELFGITVREAEALKHTGGQS